MKKSWAWALTRKYKYGHCLSSRLLLYFSSNNATCCFVLQMLYFETLYHPKTRMASSWSSLPKALGAAFTGLSTALNNDAQWNAFVKTGGMYEAVTMGVQSSGSDEVVLVSVAPGAKTTVSTGPSSAAHFTLRAQPHQWERFFGPNPQAPYTSFVGLQVCGMFCCVLPSDDAQRNKQKTSIS